MTSSGHKPQGRDEIVPAVLDAAERLFAARGPGQVGLRDIADAANVNVTLIYRHVGSKDDLLRAVAHRLVASGQAKLENETNWQDVVSLLFRTTDEYFDFTHLVAWLLLEGADPSGLDDVLPAGLGVFDRFEDVADGDARHVVAAVLAMSFGWQVFGPLLAHWLGGSTGDPDAARERVRSFLAQLAEQAPGLGQEAHPR